MPPLTPQQLAEQAAAHTTQRQLGRFSGPEFFQSQAFAISTNPVIQPNVPIGEALESLLFVLRYRSVIAVNPYTAIASESPQSIITRILITGDSVKFGQQTLLDVSGATLFAYLRCFQSRGNSNYIGSTAAAYTRQTDLNVPNQQVVGTFGQVGTADVETHIRIPFTPMGGPATRIQQMRYALRPEDWKNGVKVQVFFGDNTAWGTLGAGTTNTLTAWGSASGTPALSIYTNTVQLGNFRKSYPSAILLRSEQTVPAGTTAIGSNILLATLNKTRTSSILLKSGLSLAGSPANVYGTLSDLIFTNLQVRVNNNPIRNFQDWFAQKEYYGQQFSTILPGGYNLISFVESGNFDAYFDGTAIDAAAQFALYGNVTSAGSTQQLNYVQEQIVGNPQTRTPGTL